MRFTIRDLMWLMAVVGLSAGWIADHIRVGDSPGRLETLTEILANEDISVEFQRHRVRVHGKTDHGSWSYDTMVGESIPKTRL